jgi:hypothetical protein
MTTSQSDRPFLVCGSPLIEAPDVGEVLDSLQSGWLGTGPKVARFEQAFAASKRVEHTAAVNSCTATACQNAPGAASGTVVHRAVFETIAGYTLEGRAAAYRHFLATIAGRSA